MSSFTAAGRRQEAIISYGSSLHNAASTVFLSGRMDMETETFQHVHKQLDAFLVADQRLLEAAALVQLHRPLQDGDGGRLHP